MQKNSQDFSMQDALRLSKSPAGQQLMSLLRQADSSSLQQALREVSAGNYTSAQQILRTLLDTPEAKALLQQLEGESWTK